MKWVNLTNKSITVVSATGKMSTLPPSDNPSLPEYRAISPISSPIGDIPIERIAWGKFAVLPDPRLDTVYIVHPFMKCHYPMAGDVLTPHPDYMEETPTGIVVRKFIA